MNKNKSVTIIPSDASDWALSFSKIKISKLKQIYDDKTTGKWQNSKKNIKLVSNQKKSRDRFNLSLLSIILILYFMTNHIIELVCILNGSNTIPTVIFPAVEAIPEPEPSRPINNKPNRSPPLNGGIFGKRSVDSQASNHDNYFKSAFKLRNSGSTLGSASASASASESASVESLRPSNKTKLQVDKSNSGSSSLSNLIQKKAPSSMEFVLGKNMPGLQLNVAQSALLERSSAFTYYEDLITQIIEDFLAKNTENDPEEASVSFCRMIIVECGRLLTSRSEHRIRTRRSPPPVLMNQQEQEQQLDNKQQQQHKQPQQRILRSYGTNTWDISQIH